MYFTGWPANFAKAEVRITILWMNTLEPKLPPVVIGNIFNTVGEIRSEPAITNGMKFEKLVLQ
jgi:hypothetical protein